MLEVHHFMPVHIYERNFSNPRPPERKSTETDTCCVTESIPITEKCDMLKAIYLVLGVATGCIDSLRSAR